MSDNGDQNTEQHTEQQSPPTPPHEDRFENKETVPPLTEAERKQLLRAEASERIRILANPSVEPLEHTRILFYSLIYWDNVTKSAISLASLLGGLILSSYFTPLRLAAGLWILSIFGNLLFVHVTLQYKRITGKSAVNPHESRIKTTENGLLVKDTVDRWVGLTVDSINLAAQSAGKIILIQDTRRSLASMGWGLAVYVVAGWLPTRWILGLAIILTYSLPKIYAEHKKVVDEQIAKANVILREQTDKAHALARQHAGPYLDKATALGQQYGVIAKSKGE